MITFKEYLTEARMAPLYHATTLPSAVKIMNDNSLYGTVQEGGQSAGKKVIFVTRNIKHAEHFINYNGNFRASAIFVLDQEKLAQRYKIKPTKNWMRDREDTEWDSSKSRTAKKNHYPMYMHGVLGANEFEEIIETNKISNFSNYVTKIYVNREKPWDVSMENFMKDPRVVYKEKI